MGRLHFRCVLGQPRFLLLFKWLKVITSIPFPNTALDLLAQNGRRVVGLSLEQAAFPS